MAQIISGSALIGSGVLIDQIISSQLDNGNFNNLVIKNDGTTYHYLNIEVEDKTGTAFFDEGVGLCFSPFSTQVCKGSDANTSISSVAGYSAGDVISWSRGKHEYRFISSDDTTLPSDEVISKRGGDVIYNFYVKHSAAAATLANNYADKINEVTVDGLDELNAAFSNAGFLSFKALKTSKFNDTVIFKNGVSILTFGTKGTDPYPRAGGVAINTSAKANAALLTDVPFVAGGYGATIVVPPTSNFIGGQFQIQMASPSTDIAANTFRIKSSTSTDDLVVTIFGKTS